MRLSLQDARFGLRALRKSPASVLASVALLALGMGATSAMLSVVDSVVLRPLPFDAPERLVRIARVPAEGAPGSVGSGFSWAAFRLLREHCRSLERVSIYRGDLRNLTNLGDPESVPVAAVDGEFFPLLGVSASRGRVLGEADAAAGSPPTVVIGDAFWRSRLGSDPSAIGRDLVLNGEHRTIVGVLPATARVAVWYPASVQVWIPMSPSPADATSTRGDAAESGESAESVAGAVVGRLAPGATPAAVRAEIDSVTLSLRAGSRQTTPWRSSVVGLSEYLVRFVRPTLLALLGAALCVLVIATANFANLLLVRSLSRTHEVAIRMALGADRGRLFAEILVETLAISLGGAAAGVLVAIAGLRAIVAAFGASLPRLTQVRMSWETLAATLFVATLAGLAAAAAPCWRLTRDGVRGLSQLVGARDARSPGRRDRGRIVVAEVAFATMLLLAAGWMVRSVSALKRVPLGFEPRGLLTMTLSFPADAAGSNAGHAALVGRVLASVRRVAGVVDAGVADSLPVVGGGPVETLIQNGAPRGEAQVRSITPGYFAAMRTPVRVGRDFLEADGSNAPPVVLVSESGARALWPRQNPIGKTLTLSGSPTVRREVVGVAADVKLHDLDAVESEAAVYLPAAQSDFGSSLAVRSTTTAAAIRSSVERAIRGTSPELLLAEVSSMEDVLSDAIAQERFRASLAGLFAAIALGLTAIGVAAVLSHAARRRRREIGIRMALGAAARDVLIQIVTEGMKPVLLGATLGAVGALAVGRVLAHEIYGVRTTDPLTFAAAFLLVGFAGLLASLVPAAGAARSDPAEVLREK